MTTENKEQNPTEILKNIERLLIRIEDHLAPPPLWQRFLKFIFQNFFVFLTLLFLAYFTWQIWGTIEYVADNVSFIRDSMSSLGTSFTEKIDSFKLWN